MQHVLPLLYHQSINGHKVMLFVYLLNFSLVLYKLQQVYKLILARGIPNKPKKTFYVKCCAHFSSMCVQLCFNNMGFHTQSDDDGGGGASLGVEIVGAISIL